MNKTADFYRQFGFSEVLRWRSPGLDLEIAHLKLGDFFLELFCYQSFQDPPETAKTLDTDLPRIGVKHFGLRVKSIEETKKLLLENGTARDIEIKKGRTGIDYFFITDPDGIFVEILQDERGL
jgi:glyoxylase I family protein